jgi:hypothetical protein
LFTDQDGTSKRVVREADAVMVAREEEAESTAEEETGPGGTVAP